MESMLKVPTYLSKSKIPLAGTGLFLRKPVKAGQQICDKGQGTYDIYTENEVENSSSNFAGFIDNFAYHVGNEWRLDKDNEKFINHSRNPNLSPDGYALCDLNSDEELLYDYRQIDDKISQNPPSWL